MANTKFLHSKEPSGDLSGKWERHKNEINLVSPALLLFSKFKGIIKLFVAGLG